ncbi:MAG TPA: hypothetical protein VFB16_07665 [Bauldia sp.]|nr:hypothetical protein [Bauldia sp.]
MELMLHDGAERKPNGAHPPGADPPGVELPKPVKRVPALARIRADAVRHAELRRQVEETDAPVHAIARAFAVPSSSLYTHIKDEGWQRPVGLIRRPPADRTKRKLATRLDDAASVAERLLRVVDRQVVRVEQRLRRSKDAVEERDARLLGHLAKVLQTLMALGRDDGAQRQPESADRDFDHADLAERIARWAAGGEASL